MIEFTGQIKDLKALGYHYQLYTTSRAMTWWKHIPDNIYRPTIRLWKSGMALQVNSMPLRHSRTFIATILNEELFESIKQDIDGEVLHAFMINSKTGEYEQYIKERHNRLYVLSMLDTLPNEEGRKLLETCYNETVHRDIHKLHPDSWIVNEVKKLKPFVKLVDSVASE